ncbi:MAG TPA: signal peptidase I [Actinocrinis sp.]|nr:signal peptidase I [Actinocrinis sp.]
MPILLAACACAALALPAVAAMVAVAAAARRRLTVVAVDGESMSPTLRSGDRVLVARRTAGLAVGDVVLFRYASGPDEKLIKRVAAVAGDLVPPDVLRAVGAQPGTRVPDGLLVVIGDGVHSTDSRDFGYLSADKVIGVMVRRLDVPGGRGPNPAAGRASGRLSPGRTAKNSPNSRAAAAAAAREAISSPAHGAAPSRSRPDAAP